MKDPFLSYYLVVLNVRNVYFTFNPLSLQKTKDGTSILKNFSYYLKMTKLSMQTTLQTIFAHLFRIEYPPFKGNHFCLLSVYYKRFTASFQLE